MLSDSQTSGHLESKPRGICLEWGPACFVDRKFSALDHFSNVWTEVTWRILDIKSEQKFIGAE